jgi:hypothetical protein
MLGGVEDAPAALEQVRDGRAEEPLRRGIAVRDVESGDLVVPLVLEAVEGEERAVERRRRVAAIVWS